MKKYVIAYFILFVILLGLELTHGIPCGILVSEILLVCGPSPGIIRDIILIYNLHIMLACFVMAVILTLQKENVLKCKWLIPIIMFICFAFLPVRVIDDVRFFSSEHTKEFWSIISLFMAIYHKLWG